MLERGHSEFLGASEQLNQLGLVVPDIVGKGCLFLSQPLVGRAQWTTHCTELLGWDNLGRLALASAHKLDTSLGLFFLLLVEFRQTFTRLRVFEGLVEITSRQVSNDLNLLLIAFNCKCIECVLAWLVIPVRGIHYDKLTDVFILGNFERGIALVVFQGW